MDVIALARGLSILVPDLVGMDGADKIVVNASAERVAASVQSQLEKLHSEEPAELKKGISRDDDQACPSVPSTYGGRPGH